MIATRRFWCDAVLCGRRIFCEQFDSGVLARYGRRTQQLETIVHHLGLALGGGPAAALAGRLIVPVSTAPRRSDRSGSNFAFENLVDRDR